MTYSEIVQENQKLRWENAILKNQMDDTNAEKERADKAEAEALKYKEAHRHVLDILNVVSDIVVETKDRSENDTSQYADGQYDLCDTISKSIAWKVAAIGAQSLLEKLAQAKEVLGDV